jgi:hypothetical protein
VHYDTVNLANIAKNMYGSLSIGTATCSANRDKNTRQPEFGR